MLEKETSPTTRLGKAAVLVQRQRCHKCNNEGMAGGCPRCGRTLREAVTEQVVAMDIPTDLVPEPYLGKAWTPVQTEDAPLHFRQFDESLVKVYNYFLGGNIPRFSMFIGAPPKFGKHQFAYGCMQTAIAQRFAVAPLFSTADWRRLQKVSQMNPFYKLYGKYQWDQLIVMDVVFMYVDHSDERFDEIPLLKSVLDARASFGLSTFIISDYKLNDLVPHYNSEAYASIYNPEDKRDYLRFPVVIHRF